MQLAILGTTSQIAKYLVRLSASRSAHNMLLFFRSSMAVKQWLKNTGSLGFPACQTCYTGRDYAGFSRLANQPLERVINLGSNRAGT